MKIEILPSARDDLSAGFEFYEYQGKGLGILFLNSLFSDIDALGHFAGIHPRILGLSRALSKRFPYAIYYLIENNTARIRAVLDCRRDPDWIQARLK